LNWSDAGNWNGGVPTSGESGGTFLVFPAVAGELKTTTDDLNALTVDQISFTSPDYSIGGTGANVLIFNSLLTNNPSIVDSAGGTTFAKSLVLTVQSNSESLALTTAGSDLIASAISGPGGLVKQGGGTLILSGANTLAGTIAVFDGTVQQGAATAIPSGASVLIQPRPTGILDLNGFDMTIRDLFGGGVIELGSNNLTLSSGDYDGKILGSGGLVKQGTDQFLFALNGLGSYTGPTQIEQGTLDVGGTLTGGVIHVGAAGELDGSGTVSTVDVFGSVDAVERGMQPGTSNIITRATTLNAGAVSFEAGSTYGAYLAGRFPGNSSLLSASGPVNLAGASLDVTIAFPAIVGDQFLVVQSPAVSGTFANLPNGATFATNGYTFQVAYSATGASITVVAAPPIPDFVPRLYSDLLHRPADPLGMAAWNAQLTAGVTTATVVYEIETCGSQEYQTLEIKQAYQTLLHRAPDPSGLQTGLIYLANFGLLAEYSRIASSPEFQFLQGGGTVNGWVTALYTDALGRQPDPLGLASFTQALTSGALSFQQAADLVFHSDEYYASLVDGYYSTFLRRPPEESGLTTWVSCLRLGFSPEQVISCIAGSKEYYIAG
jgi:autotransporter-associated beta strand protein